MTIQYAGDEFQPVAKSGNRVGDCVSRTSQGDWSQIVNFRILEAGGVDFIYFHYDPELLRNVLVVRQFSDFLASALRLL